MQINKEAKQFYKTKGLEITKITPKFGKVCLKLFFGTEESQGSQSGCGLIPPLAFPHL